MPSHSNCTTCSRALSRKENESSEKALNRHYGASFLFGIFELDAMHEFLAIHEAKRIASEVNNLINKLCTDSI